MGRDTKIGWCDHTFNVVWGCTEISPGCKHCYAREWAARFGTHWGDDAARRTMGDKKWAEPLAWDRQAQAAGVPALVFCGSMFDIWENHPGVRRECERLWPLIDKCQWLIWLLLSKRPGNALEFAPPAWRGGWPDNVWAMTTIENQTYADRRLGLLRQIPAKVRGVSAEPLLGEVDVRRWLAPGCPKCVAGTLHAMPEIATDWLCNFCGERTPRAEVRRPIDWMICGGESEKPDVARPFRGSWADKLRVQCGHYDVPFFMKQLGSNYIHDLDPDYLRCHKCAALINAQLHQPRKQGERWVIECPNPACRQTIPARWNLAHPKGEDIDEFPRSLRVRDFPDRPLAPAPREGSQPLLFT